MKKTLIYLLAVLTATLVLAGTAMAAAPYTRGEPALYTIEYRYIVKNTSSQASTSVTVTVPGMHTEPFSYQEVLSSHYSMAPASKSRDARGGLTLEFVIPRLAAGGSVEIVQQYLVRNYSINYNFAATGSFPAPHASYLQPEDKVESDHSEIKAKAREITSGMSTPLDKARAIFAFVQQYMNYGSGNKGALYALRTAQGVCEDYSALFTALCRAAGVPARLVTGQVFNSSGQLEKHGWAEFYLASHGWVPVEPTVISQHVPWHYFGAIPSSYRHFPFSLQNNSWKWSWYGGSIAVSASSSLKAGQHIPLFVDTEKHWAHSYIEDLALRGIVSGYEGRYNPDGTLTRGEFAKLIVLANGLAPGFGPSPFTDVKEGDWFHPYVLAANNAGLFTGLPGGTFGPHDSITREQLAVVLARSLGFDGKLKGNVTLSFSDTAAISDWALPYVQYAVSRNLFQGDDKNRFRPADTCSRAEAAALLYRYLTN